MRKQFIGAVLAGMIAVFVAPSPSLAQTPAVTSVTVNLYAGRPATIPCWRNCRPSLAGRQCPRRDRTCHHTPRKTLRSLSVTNAGSLTIIGWTFCPLCQSRARHRLPVHPRITQVRFLFSDN